jgi:NAD(P)-dependent dehydrogenase (short-subunit alcohol dehydrogenase family)
MSRLLAARAMADVFVQNGEMDERAPDAARSQVAMQRFGTIRDVAEAVCVLPSPRASCTGQSIDVDGAYSVMPGPGGLARTLR